jgi:hypothetical protein
VKISQKLKKTQGLSQSASLDSSACTAKTKYRNFETNIPRKGISGPQSQFPHSCVCERFICIFPRSVSLFCWRKYACIPILGLYKSLTDTWMLKLVLRPRYSQKRNIKVGFSLQCGSEWRLLKGLGFFYSVKLPVQTTSNKMSNCSGDLYGIRDEAEDRAQPEEKGEPPEEAGHELDPFRGFGRRRQGIRPVPLCVWSNRGQTCFLWGCIQNS